MDHNYPSGYGAENDSSPESTLAEVRTVITQLEEELKAKGTHLSGRIIHVTHYLPIVTTLKASNKSSENVNASTSTSSLIGAPLSPPKTPVKDIVSLEAEKANKAGEFIVPPFSELWDCGFSPYCLFLLEASRFLDTFPDVVDQPLGPLPPAARFETAHPSFPFLLHQFLF